MRADIAANQEYLNRVEAAQGRAAARQAEDSLRRPYLLKLDELAAARGDVFLDVQMVTLGEGISFSALSFDGSLTAKDPVSIVFFGNARLEAVYAGLTAGSDCAGEACTGEPPQFFDEDGAAGPGGVRSCQSQTQWVLMGAAGSEPEWRLNTRGLMGTTGGCASGVRDHIRFFGDMVDAEFGSWFVATPHREEWTSIGHVVRSWQAPAQTFLNTWTATSSLYGFSSGVSGAEWARCDAKSAGLYQGVPFDGQLAVIAIP